MKKIWKNLGTLLGVTAVFTACTDYSRYVAYNEQEKVSERIWQTLLSWKGMRIESTNTAIL